jgi:hypothetical protein
MSRINLEPAPPLKSLIKIAVDAEDEMRTQCTGLGKADIVEVRKFKLRCREYGLE